MDTTNWKQALPLLLVLNEQGVLEVRKEFERMAFLADQFGKPLGIEVYAMAGDSLAPDAAQVRYYDVLVRCDGEDPIEEYENLEEYPASLIEKLQVKYPGASFDEIGG